MHPLAAALAAIGAVAYPFVEARWYHLTHRTLAYDRRVPELSILHISDTHANAKDTRLMRFISSLNEHVETPDLVVATGDLIEDDTGIGPLADALNALDARLGRFYVLGSHDYYNSRFQSYGKYFTGRGRSVTRAPVADTMELEARLADGGWHPVSNRTEVIETPQGPIRVAGVDDPYLRRHSTEHIERRRDEAFAIGLVHCPDVVSEWLLGGFDLVLAGHTHAGQVRVPGLGALVTNSSLPAHLAGGAHRIGSGWLHTSPGLGTGRFTPVRFNCRPEATLLRISPPPNRAER